MPHRPLWVAHRGASREHRENTLAAFARALELGADAIELDVHLTSDGIPVVHHDPEVRTGDSTIPIASSTLADLRKGGIAHGPHIPTLAETCDLVGGRAELLVELKGTGIERAVITALRDHRGPWAVHSFDHAAIARVAAAFPATRRGLLYDTNPIDLPADVARAAAHDVWPRVDLATLALVDHAHALGLRVIAWTVNDPARGAALAADGVDGLCTDDVRWLRDLQDLHFPTPFHPQGGPFSRCEPH